MDCIDVHGAAVKVMWVRCSSRTAARQLFDPRLLLASRQYAPQNVQV